MTRKRVAVPVAIDLLAGLMRTGNTIQNVICAQGVPSDARHVGEFTDGKAVYFVFEHDSFAPIPEGERLPVVKVIYRLTNGE